MVPRINESHHRGIRVLLFTSTIGTFILGIFNPFYTIYIQKLGGSLEMVGLSWSVFFIVSGVLIFALASFESSFKNKKTLYIAGLFLRGIAFLLYVFISSFYQLLFAQILLGISIALINPAFDTLFTKQTNKHDAIKDWGGWEGLMSISAGVASLVGGYFIENFGFSYVFGAMSAVSFLTCLYLMTVPKEVLR